MVSSEFSVCRQEVSFLLCTAGGKRTTEPIARRHASGAGKPNGWLVAPTYYRGSRPSSPRPSGPLHFAIQQIFVERGTVASLTSVLQEPSDQPRVRSASHRFVQPVARHYPPATLDFFMRILYV